MEKDEPAMNAPYPFLKTDSPEMFGWDIPEAYYEIFWPGTGLACNLFHTQIRPPRDADLLGPFSTPSLAAEFAVEHAKKYYGFS